MKKAVETAVLISLNVKMDHASVIFLDAMVREIVMKVKMSTIAMQVAGLMSIAVEMDAASVYTNAVITFHNV